MKRRKDKPQSRIYIPGHKPFIEAGEILQAGAVTWKDLKEWKQHSLPILKARIPAAERYKPRPNSLGYMDRARHHTTRGRKKKRMIDRYWFVHRNDRTGYIEDANDDKIPSRQTTIYPPFLPRHKRLNGELRVRRCRMCNEEFQFKRVDAEYCSPKCRQAAKRARRK
jgi:hypothetical protein